MTSRDFCFWLQGFFELRETGGPDETISPRQAEMIRRHLALVFKHEIDPAIESEKPGSKPDLDAIHHGPFHPQPLIRC